MQAVDRAADSGRSRRLGMTTAGLAVRRRRPLVHGQQLAVLVDTRPTVRRRRHAGSWRPCDTIAGRLGRHGHGGVVAQRLGRRQQLGTRRAGGPRLVEAADTPCAAGRAGARRRRAGGRGRRRACGRTCPTSSRRRCGSTNGSSVGSTSKRVHRDRSRLALDLDALAGQLVQPPAVDLQRADHRRHLHDRARSGARSTAARTMLGGDAATCRTCR